jgi:hypothetical protein
MRTGQTIVAQCGDVLIAIYPDGDEAPVAPQQQEEVSAPPSAMTAWDAPAPAAEIVQVEALPEPEPPAPFVEAPPSAAAAVEEHVAPDAPKKKMATLKGHDKQVHTSTYPPCTNVQQVKDVFKGPLSPNLFVLVCMVSRIPIGGEISSSTFL